jgi:hypothetical protein
MDLDKYCEENEIELMRIDGHDNAIVGVIRGTGFPHNTEAPRLVYDVDKILENLMGDGIDEEEAEEFFEYNIIGSYMGKQTPLFLNRVSFAQANKKGATAEVAPDDQPATEVED